MKRAALLSGGSAAEAANGEPAGPAEQRGRAAAAAGRTRHPAGAPQQDPPGDCRQGGRAPRSVRPTGRREGGKEPEGQSNDVTEFHECHSSNMAECSRRIFNAFLGVAWPTF